MFTPMLAAYAIFLVAPPAATPIGVEVDVDMLLVKGMLKLPTAATSSIEYSGNDCKLTTTANSDELKGECKAVFDAVKKKLGGIEKQEPPIKLKATNGAELELKFNKLVNGAPLTVVLKGNLSTIPDLKPTDVVYERLKEGDPQLKKLENGGYDIDNATTDKAVFAVVEGMIRPLKLPEKIVAPPVDQTPPAAVDAQKALDICRATVGFSVVRSLCINVDANLIATIVHTPSRYRDHVIPPNTALELFLVHDPSVVVTATLAGDPGLYEPETRLQSSGQAGAQGAGRSNEEESKLEDLPARRLSFAPRMPSSDVPLTIEAIHKAVNGGKPVASKFEFVVEKTYSGAVRLGIGALIGSAVDVDYGAEKIGNSMQSQIVAKSDGRFEFEFVVGYSPYVFDMIRGKKGRRYHNTRLRDRAYGFSPYIGLGVLNVARAADVEFFRSVHLGLEWEPFPNFSIAVTAVARRVTRLQDNLHVGSPVSGTDPPTRERIAWGMGIVLNLTSEFFRFATRDAAGLIRRTP